MIDSDAALNRCACHWDSVGGVLRASFPLLDRIMALGEGHLLVAGGAVVDSLLKGQAPLVCDCDLFFVGVDETNVMPLLTKIMTAFEGQENCTFYRSSHCVTVNVNGTVYQFIQRLYPFPDQVMGGFDIAAAGVGWTPASGVVATPLAAFCIVYGIVIADISRRSPTWELRLCKYQRKGFTVIFPSIQRQSGWGGYHELNVGMLTMTTWHMSLTTKASLSDEPKSDYGFGKELLDPPARMMKVLLYRNILMACAGKPQNMTLHAATFAELLNEPSVCTIEELKSVFEERALRRRGFNLHLLCRYERWYGKDFDAFLLAKVANQEVEIRAITNRLVERVQLVFDEAVRASSKPLEWITKNPGRQWTSSFQPIESNARSFYGKCYSPFVVGLPQDISCELYRLRKFHHGWAALPRSLYERIVLLYLLPYYFVHVFKARKQLSFLLELEN